ncbi:AAA family ATPase [Planococcus halotolerans]|uniref:ATP-binding protein n=1 Tax=Planococcus halotolerans TaxID=2233542 RepID=UPI003F79A400
MKIEKMIVYGFGKHEDLTLDIHEELAVFYGNNEAGKTTIQQFIIQILFGFPSRNQAGNRYEPKMGGRYGGQLHLDDAQFGKVVIERIKGKAAGDVTVYFEDGSRGTETELKTILRDYDRSSFEAIFSFSIHELQGLDKMTEEQLSRTLLASGTTGVDSITQMETELEKDMGNLFKKGGRNPQLNLLIEQLRNDEKALKEHREQADLYGPYLEKLNLLNKRLEEISARENAISEMLSKAARKQQAAPLMQQKKKVEEQLGNIHVQSFPADGSRRMERLAERMSAALAKKKHSEHELAVLPETSIIEKNGDAIAELLEKESEWLRLLSRSRDLDDESGKLEEELGRQLGLIGMGLDEALKFDVSLVNEEKLLKLAERANKEEEDSRFHDRELQDEKKKLIEAEKEMSYLESAAPTEEQQDAAAKWPENSLKLAEAKALKRMKKDPVNHFFSYMLIALAVAGVLTGLLQSDMLIVAIAAAAALGGLWMLWKATSKNGSFEDMDDVIKRFSGKEAEMEMLQRKIAEHNRKVEETLRDIARSDKRIDELMNELNHKPAKSEFDAYLENLGITSSASSSTVIELFKTIRKVQEIHGKLNRTQESLDQIKYEEGKWLEKAAAETGKNIQPGDLYIILRAEANKLNELKEENRRIADKREVLTAELQQQSSYIAELDLEKTSLLEECGAADVEEFHQFHLEWLRKKELQQELELVVNQLEAIGSIDQRPDESDVSLKEHISNLEDEYTLLKNERNQTMNERAELQQRVNHLLTDEAYEVKLQNYEEKKEQFNELARRWSVDKAIIEAIRSTMAELKEKSLPAVLSKACEYFQRLTGDSYTGMEINPDGHFEAIRKDNIRFRIAELSQATKEQAYLALRLSLAVSMQKSHPFPIIMDDPFVHFDRLRLQQVINLIKELQTDHQFIYFTCHEDMCRAWPEAQVIDVANTGRSVYL